MLTQYIKRQVFIIITYIKKLKIIKSQLKDKIKGQESNYQQFNQRFANHLIIFSIIYIFYFIFLIFHLIIKMQSQQISVQNFISYIKNISLHFQNLLAPNQQDLKGIKHKTFKLINDFDKFITQYNRKVLSEIQNAKITVPLIFYRSIKDKVSFQNNWMRYKHKQYQLKFVFIRINLQCHVHVQICKNTSNIRKTSLAYQKLENNFIYMLHKKLTSSYYQQDRNALSINFFEENALKYLQEVSKLMNGQIVCYRCRKSMSYHPDLKVILPPTVRLETISANIEKKQQKQGSQLVHLAKYCHENCL